jgi:ECF sigma factor
LKIFSRIRHVRIAREGDKDAIQRLWDLYSQRLAELARKGLKPGERRIADEEDIANMALATFFRRVKDGNFFPPERQNRSLAALGADHQQAQAIMY